MKRKLTILEDERQYIKGLYGILTEQSKGMEYQFDWNSGEATPSNIKLITLKGTYIESNGKIKFVETPKVFKILSDTLYISIPGSEAEYEAGVYFTPSYMSTVIQNYDDLRAVISILKSLNKKFQKIIVGGHGSPGNLFHPISMKGIKPEDYNYAFKTYWLEGLKDLVESPSSEVHFVECFGAEFLSILKDAASVIGVDTYGGKNYGVQNIVTGSRAHLGNYYVCTPKKVSPTDFDSYYFKDKDNVYWRKKDFPDWKSETKNSTEDKNNWLSLFLKYGVDYLPYGPPFKNSNEANKFRTYVYKFYPDLGKKYNVKTSDSSSSISDLVSIWDVKVEDKGLLPSPSSSLWGEKGKTVGNRYMYYLKKETENQGKEYLKPTWSSGYESRTSLPKQNEIRKPLGFFNNGISEVVDFDDEFLLEKKYCSVTSQPSYFSKILGNVRLSIENIWNIITTGKIGNPYYADDNLSKQRQKYTTPEVEDVYKLLDKNKK